MKKYYGFTLAEVLITLAIIGIVSAIVIPTVVKNYNDRKYNTARLKALKTFGEAGKLASINGEINGQPSARAFVENVLSKYLKITKVCDNDKASECNFPSEIQPSDPSADKVISDNLKRWNQIILRLSGHLIPHNKDAMSVYIVTADGFSAKVFYNPKCVRNSRESSYDDTCTSKECPSCAVDDACLNFIYDMNGIKTPNHTGEDIGFVTVFWSGLNTTAVAPRILPYNIMKSIYDEGGGSWANVQKKCSNKGTNKNPYTLANIDELSSVIINDSISSIIGNNYWSGSPVSENSELIWYMNTHSMRMQAKANSNIPIYCVRR